MGSIITPTVSTTLQIMILHSPVIATMANVGRHPTTFYFLYEKSEYKRGDLISQH